MDWWASDVFGGVDLEYCAERLEGADELMHVFRTCSEQTFRELFAHWIPEGDVDRYVRKIDLTSVLGRGVLARRVYERAEAGTLPGVRVRGPTTARRRVRRLFELTTRKFRKPFYRNKLSALSSETLASNRILALVHRRATI